MSSSIISPFLDNIGTVGAQKVSGSNVTDYSVQRLRNRKRGFLHAEGAAVNKRVYYQLQDFLKSKKAYEISDDSLHQFCLLRTRLAECCKHSLYRQFHDDNDLQFIAAHTCDHKYCFVCNKLRSKTIRRKFVMLFKQYPDLRKNYDFMHLTLTVPHTENGWRGEQFYASELMKQFNLMRKKDFWKHHVYAGEFGVEMTKNESGLHIHIHSLLLVKKSRGNRNELHRNILLHWNKNTSDGNHVPLSNERIAEIKKSNKTIVDFDTAKLTATGATIIGLESLYVLSDSKINNRYKWCGRNQRFKKYIDSSDDKEFISGIMECIKYHFEPSGMYLHEGKLDFDLLNELLPKIYRKPLYRKFGAFHTGSKDAHPGAALLNFNDAAKEPLDTTLEETANETVKHPSTGADAGREEYSYFVSRADKIYYDKEADYKPTISPHSDRKYLHNARTMHDALIDMFIMSNPFVLHKEQKGEVSTDMKKRDIVRNVGKRDKDKRNQRSIDLSLFEEKVFVNIDIETLFFN